jgi:hypothetical protein
MNTTTIKINGADVSPHVASARFVTDPEPEAPADQFTEIVYAALMEAGHPELAHGFLVFLNADGTPYVEPLDELDPADLAIVEKAEQLALEAIARPSSVSIGGES